MAPLALFGISILMSLLSSSIAARLYIWPKLRVLDRNRALAWLVAPHMFVRFLGLSFLVTGVISASLPNAFSVPAVCGDAVAGLLAMIAALALESRASWAEAAVWVFNIWGAADLIFAFYRGKQGGLQPGELGAAYYLVTAVVPVILVSHALVFGLLLRRTRAAETSQIPSSSIS